MRSFKLASMAMQLRLTRTMWGIFDFARPEPHNWEPTFRRLKEEKFGAIECCVGPFDCFQSNQALALELLKKYNLDCIRQVHTCGYPIQSRKVEDHINSFKEMVFESKKLGAFMVNSHSGYDGWSLKEAVDFFKACVQIEKDAGIPCVHETHRRRCFYNPWFTRDILAQVPELKVNCDLSHWVVVGERLYSDPADEEFSELFAKVANKTYLIHARVGYSQGPQVPDPSAPEYEEELKAHEVWWDTILRCAAKRGDTVFYLEPEFGPPPYLHTLPHTNVPVADLWRVNTWYTYRAPADVKSHADSLPN